MSRLSRRSGFTLFELLVVIAVLSVVSGLGVYTYIGFSSLWRDQRARAELDQQAALVFQWLRRDAANLLPAHWDGAGILGEEGAYQDPRYLRVTLQSDQLTLPVRGVHPETSLPEYYRARYHIVREGGVPALHRTLGGMDTVYANGASTPIARGVMDLHFEYHDGREWVAGWQREEHPEAVRVSITLGAGEPEYHEQISRAAVIPLRVR